MGKRQEEEHGAARLRSAKFIAINIFRNGRKIYGCVSAAFFRGIFSDRVGKYQFSNQTMCTSLIKSICSPPGLTTSILQWRDSEVVRVIIETNSHGKPTSGDSSSDSQEGQLQLTQQLKSTLSLGRIRCNDSLEVSKQSSFVTEITRRSDGSVRSRGPVHMIGSQTYYETGHRFQSGLPVFGLCACLTQ